MKHYEVTTVKINLQTFEKETLTVLWREDEMLAGIKKPRNLYKTVVNYSYKNDIENTFYNMTVTRVK